MAPNFTPELIQLIDLSSRVAVAIRGRSSNRNDSGQDVMWLADSIMLFRHIARAIGKQDWQQVRLECGDLLNAYRAYRDRGEDDELGHPMTTFDRTPGIDLDDLEQAIQAIADKAFVAHRAQHVQTLTPCGSAWAVPRPVISGSASTSACGRIVRPWATSPLTISTVTSRATSRSRTTGCSPRCTSIRPWSRSTPGSHFECR